MEEGIPSTILIRVPESASCRRMSERELHCRQATVCDAKVFEAFEPGEPEKRDMQA